MHAQCLGKVELEQAMVADHLEGDLLSRSRQLDPTVRLMHGEVERGELFHHRACRSRRDAETLRESGYRDASTLRAELVDLAQIVLDRVGQCGLGHPLKV